MAETLLNITFATGLFVAFMHVANRRFIAPIYDIVANLTGFACATAASALLGHWPSTALAGSAVGCWLWLAWRTASSMRAGHPAHGQLPPTAVHPLDATE